jgi:hypothetical protein
LDSGGGATHDRAGDDVSYEAGDDTSQAPNDDGGDDADDGGRTAPEGGPSDAGASDGLAPPADSGGDVFFTPDTGTVSPICDSNPKYAAEAELEFDEGMENTICTMGACAASECCYEPATPPCAGCSNLCLPR